jgi:tRNA-splicing ligase RtcB (3'-phosphate/5'-hydroxy nucleic acid ligase)
MLIPKRINDSCCQIENKFDLDIKLFANKDVQIEKETFVQLEDFLDTYRCVKDLTANTDFLEPGSLFHKVALTPGFHKGPGIPVGTAVETSGFVLPQAIGNDICCGMRLLARII